MKQISIDNGNSYISAKEALQIVPLDVLAVYMDSDTRERVHWELAPCSDLSFLVRYLEIAPENFIVG